MTGHHLGETGELRSRTQRTHLISPKAYFTLFIEETLRNQFLEMSPNLSLAPLGSATWRSVWCQVD